MSIKYAEKDKYKNVLDFESFCHSHSKVIREKKMASMNIEILEAVSEKLEVRFGCNKKRKSLIANGW